MCGVIGAVVADRALIEWVDAATDRLAHRGPDARGTAIDAEAGIAFGHRRLAVIDLSERGVQPMTVGDGDGAVTIVCNGEIYNYRELRSQLEASGRSFRTETDTEVVVQAYLEWGDRCVERFVGMWAFALWDRRSGTVALCRDPFGIKPLYWGRRGRSTIFGSEPGIVADGIGDRSPDLQVVHDFVRWADVDRGTRTWFAGVSRVAAGEWRSVDVRTGAHSARRYWSAPAPAPEPGLPLREAADRLLAALVRSVELHLRADVPVGSALSGGIDSSGIVALVREVGGASVDLHTVSYRAADPTIDESRWIDLSTRRVGAIGHDVTIRDDEVAALVERVAVAQGQPYGSLSIAAQFRVFEEAQRHGLTVMLDGQGADELFGGYPSFVVDRLVGALRQGRFGIARSLVPAVASAGGRGAVARCLVRALPRPVAVALWARWMGRTTPSWIDVGWFGERGVTTAVDPAALPRDFDDALGLAVGTTSLPALLRYEDRNSMAHSIESRVPYLTTELAELAATFPREVLIDRHGTTKVVLREALRGIVADDVLDRRDKVAFSVPAGRWMGRLDPAAQGDGPTRWRTAEAVRSFPVLAGTDGPFTHVEAVR